MDIITIFSNKMPGVKQWVERTFPAVGRMMNNRRTKLRTNAYKAYGLETAQKFDECMTAGGYKYMLIGITSYPHVWEFAHVWSTISSLSTLLYCLWLFANPT